MHFLAASSARDDVYSRLWINIGAVTLASVEGIGSLITMFVAIDLKVHAILKEKRLEVVAQLACVTESPYCSAV